MQGRVTNKAWQARRSPCVLDIDTLHASENHGPKNKNKKKDKTRHEKVLLPPDAPAAVDVA